MRLCMISTFFTRLIIFLLFVLCWILILKEAGFCVMLNWFALLVSVVAITD